MHTAVVLDATLGPPAASSSVGTSPAIVSSSLTSVPITTRDANINGVMHGGAYGVIFDMLTTIALAPVSRPGYWECVCSRQHTATAG